MGKHKTLEEWKEDLTGKIFGRLTVLGVKQYYRCGKKNGFEAICKCDCGKEKKVFVTNLISGKVSSCGCLSKELSSDKLHIWRKSNLVKQDIIEERRKCNIKKSKELSSNLLLDKYKETLVSKTFGDLTVLEIHNHIRKSTNRKDGFEAICKCICGNRTSVNLSNLLSGNTTSCGCHKGKTLEKWKEDLIGKNFGRLTVLGIEQSYKKDKKKGYNAICKCTCGNIVVYSTDSLVNRRVVSCGCYRKEKSKCIGKSVGYKNITNAIIWWKEHPDDAKRIQKKAVTAMLEWRKRNPDKVQILKDRSTLALAHSSISKEEEDIYTFLKSLGYDIERQYLLESHYFDFRINNFLIEYNGSVYHSTEFLNLTNPHSKIIPCRYKKPNYHLHLYNLALQNKYRLIQIWDYQWLNRKTFIKKLIKDQLLGAANYKDYLESEDLLNNDYGFVIEGEHIEPKGTWISTGYRKVVDESYTKGKVFVYNSGYTKIGETV